MLRLALFQVLVEPKGGLNLDTVAGLVARVELNQALTVQLTVIRVGWLKKLRNTMRYGEGNNRVGMRFFSRQLKLDGQSGIAQYLAIGIFIGGI